MAHKYNLTGKQIGKLTVGELVPKELRPTQTHGNYWYCHCSCGKDVMIPTTYLSGKGNYTQTSCGCDRKIKAFLASCKMSIDEDFLNKFDNLEKFLFLHKQLTLVSGKTPTTYEIEEYKNDIIYFYYQEQFNNVYNFWLNHSKDNTFYDWAKPSLDHIIPKSKGGSNKKENLQFLTVFENLAKRDMTQEEWDLFKKNTNTHSDYFIESIMKRGNEE